MSQFFSGQLSQLAPYTPGEQPKDKNYVKLNANESPYPPSPGVLRAVSALAGRMNLYPDAACRGLKAALARRYGVGPENVMVTAGSDDILNFCFMAYGERGAGRDIGANEALEFSVEVVDVKPYVEPAPADSTKVAEPAKK